MVYPSESNTILRGIDRVDAKTLFALLGESKIRVSSLNLSCLMLTGHLITDGFVSLNVLPHGCGCSAIEYIFKAEVDTFGH